VKWQNLNERSNKCLTILKIKNFKSPLDFSPSIAYNEYNKSKGETKMKKISGQIGFEYTFNSAHKGAPYTLDGTHYMNGGEFKEIVAKYMTGYMGGKDANTRYDMGSDIPEMNASVKSSKATLVNMKLGNDLGESLDTYFENVHSDLFIWVSVIEENATLYMMNADEFRTFCFKFSGMNERGFVRFKAESGKMLAFLESLN
jgi:hypothetical protein